MTATTDTIMKSDRRGRLRYTIEQREALLDAFAGSGLSGPRFAALHGVNYQTLAGWFQRRKRTGPAESAARPLTLLPVVRADIGIGSGPERALEVLLPGGARLAVTCRTQIALVVELVRELQQARAC
jgi:hypothetical protein